MNNCLIPWSEQAIREFAVQKIIASHLLFRFFLGCPGSPGAPPSSPPSSSSSSSSSPSSPPASSSPPPSSPPPPDSLPGGAWYWSFSISLPCGQIRSNNILREQPEKNPTALLCTFQSQKTNKQTQMKINKREKRKKGSTYVIDVDV